MKRHLLIQVLVLLAASCSIKENRSECPCALDVGVSGGNESRVSIFIRGGETSLDDVLETGGTVAHGFYSVSRGILTLAACSGLKHQLTDRGELILGPGEQMDEIFAVSEKLDTRAENVMTSALLKKQFAYLHLKLKFFSGAGNLPAMKLSGNVSGMDMMTLKPLYGNFDFPFVPVVDDYCRIALPRQTADSSLELAIETFGEMDLKALAAEAGYDWDSPSLDDIYMDIDLVNMKAFISVSRWEDGGNMNVDI